MRVTITDDMIEEKVESMRVVGQLVPLIVTPMSSPPTDHPRVGTDELMRDHVTAGGTFEIIDGHCRWLAAELVPLAELDCCVFLDVQEAKHAMMLHAGIIRQSFTAYEEGRQFIELSNAHGWSLDQLCKTFHRSESYINDRVAVAMAPEPIAVAVHTRVINLSQAKQVLLAKDEMLRGYLLEQASVHGATARSLEVMRHNWNVENVPRADGEHLHTPAYSPEQNPADREVCIWCDGGDDPENFRRVVVHWYHQRDLMAVVDQVGSKNLHRAAPTPEPVSGES
jgi:ParB-like chromosome segregation protein Spo0J